MKVNLYKSPVHKVVLIDNLDFTFECTCGKEFITNMKEYSELLRCPICSSAKLSHPFLFPSEITELFTYVYDEILTQYPNKLTRN